MRYALRTALSLGKLVFENKKEYEDVTLDDWISEKDPLSKPQRLKRPKKGNEERLKQIESNFAFDGGCDL